MVKLFVLNHVEGFEKGMKQIGYLKVSQKSKTSSKNAKNISKHSSGKDFTLGEQTLLRFAWRTTSCMEEVSWPSIDM
jgi:hypothetical protein